MSYEMKFQGSFSFSNKKMAQKAIQTFKENECLDDSFIQYTDLHLENKNIFINVDGSAPASMWESTTDLISDLSKNATDGYIDAFFEQEEGEYVLRILPNGNEIELGESKNDVGASDEHQVDDESVSSEQEKTAEKFDDAAMHGNIKLVKKYLKNGLNPELALSGALAHPQILKLLISNGAKPKLHLRWAAQFGYLESTQIIIDLGINPDQLDPNDFFNTTPLMMAAYHGQVEVVAALLKAGANPNKVDLGKQHALFHAVLNRQKAGRLSIISKLIAAGAKTKLRDTGNKTPADIVKKYQYTGYKEVLKLLL